MRAQVIINDTWDQIHSLYTAHKLFLYKGGTNVVVINFFNIPFVDKNITWQAVMLICPPVLWTKLNTDGASRGNPSEAGAAGILRISNGCFLFAFSKYLGNQSSIFAEAYAILLG